MPSTPPPGRTRSRWAASAVLVAGLLLAGCGTPAVPGASPSPAGTDTPLPTTASGSAAAPSPSPSDYSSPDSPASPGDTPGQGDPGATPSIGSAAPSVPDGSATPSPGPTPLSCSAVTPVRVDKVDSQPRRTTEVVTVVSDGKSLTSGTREQTEFLAPTLQAGDGTQLTDEATTKRVAALIAASGKNRVLLSRPEAPDAGASASRRPFNSAGTYVLFNASSPVTATVLVQCSGQEQRWSFTGEADPTSGQVNCAVEPARTNVIAHLVYADNCD